MLRALKVRLLEEAAEPRYAPEGGVILLLPRELENLLGADRVFVYADGRGLWAAPASGPGGRPALCCRWEPDAPFTAFLLPEDPLQELVLAALWHDLRVGGPQAFRRPAAGQPLRPPAEPEGSPAPRPVLLPRTRWVFEPGEERLWGSYAEWSHARRAHGVRGHLRRLLNHQRPSAQALKFARDYGLIVPKGYTFVRPHVRGRRAADEDSGQNAQLTVGQEAGIAEAQMPNPIDPKTGAAKGRNREPSAWESCLGLVPNSRQARPLPAPDGFARIQAIVGVPIRGAGPSRGTSAATLHYLSAPPAGQAFGVSRPAPGDSDGEPTTLPAGPPQAVLDQGENGQEKRHEADDGIQADHHGRGA